MPTTGPTLDVNTGIRNGKIFLADPGANGGQVPSQIAQGFAQKSLLEDAIAGALPTDEFDQNIGAIPAGLHIQVFGDQSAIVTADSDGTYVVPRTVRKNYAETSVPMTFNFGPVSPQPTVTGITANPTAATVAGGSTTSVAIAVQGRNNPAQTFTSAKQSGPGSVNGGAITMPVANYSTQVGVFRFRPTLDPNYFVDVTLTVAALDLPTDPGTIDATKVPPARTVVFPGSKRVVTFAGSIRKVDFNG